MKTNPEARAWSSRLAACRCLPVILFVAAMVFASCQGGGGGGGAGEPSAPPAAGDKGTVVLAAVIPPGGEVCADTGGVHIDWGIDLDGDGVLDGNEITGSGDICNGASGTAALATLVKTTALPLQDANCPTGGAKIEMGVDANANGTLDSAEVNATLTQFVCNGAGGGAGMGAALAITQDPPECPAGGVKIESGPDADSNGIPDSIASTEYVCNGAAGDDGVDGFTALIAVTPEPAGPTNCPFGGQRIVMGLDNGDGGGTARDGVLDPGEIDGPPHFVCAYGAGKGEGSTIAALTVTAGQVYHASVSAGGASYYRWTAPEAGGAVIGLARTDSDLAWTVYADAFTTPLKVCDNHTGTDGDEFCFLPVLNDATDYYLAVSEKSGMPSLFDLYLNAPVLVAADPVGRIYRIDLEAGTTHFLAHTGVAGLSSVVWLPQADLVRAGTRDTGYSTDCPGCVYSLDPFSGESGQLTEELQKFSDPYHLEDLTVDPDSGVMYGSDMKECNVFYEIAPLDGFLNKTITRPSGSACTSQATALTFDGSGFLYVAADLNPSGPLHLWSTEDITAPTPTWSDHGTMNFRYFDLAPRSIVSMTVSPIDGKAYGIAVDDTPYQSSYFLASIDLQWGYVSYLADLPGRLDGLAFVGGGRVPWFANAYGLYTTSEVSVSWRPYRNAVYNIYWVVNGGPIDPADPGTYDEVETDYGFATIYSVNFAQCNVPYTFLVAAVVDGNEVAYSNQPSATLPPPCP